MPTLIERQNAMKTRHKRRPRQGRPAREVTAEMLEKGRRRFVAWQLLEKGYSPEHVASWLNVQVEAVRRWVDAGCPLR
jgi:hypothetical protein